MSEGILSHFKGFGWGHILVNMRSLKNFYLSLLKIFQIHAQGKKLNSTEGREMKNTVSHPTPFNPRPIP